MKRLIRLFLLSVFAICLSIPCLNAEAASIALLPLINNVEGDTLANQVFYKSAINSINRKAGFVIVENDKLTAAIEAANVGKEVPSKDVLAKIAKDGNADLVIAMQLDVLDDVILDSSNERELQLQLEGKAVAYNKLIGEFYSHKITDSNKIPEALSARWDWTHEEWGRNVSREIDRILKIKGVRFDAPRMSKL